MQSINAAVPLYLGYGTASFPTENASRLVAEFGPETGSKLERQVKLLLEELNKIKADWSLQTLVSGSKWAVSELRQKHPELDDQAVAALEWTYSWWWK
jgi:hypothetical protein